MTVADGIKENLPLCHFVWRNLHPNCNTPIIRPIVAVVKQTDIPVGTHTAKKLDQRSWTFGETQSDTAVHFLIKEIALLPYGADAFSLTRHRLDR